MAASAAALISGDVCVAAFRRAGSAAVASGPTPARIAQAHRIAAWSPLLSISIAGGAAAPPILPIALNAG